MTGLFRTLEFVETNVLGTVILLNAFNKLWKNNFSEKFLSREHRRSIWDSGRGRAFAETTPYDPRSPYSASKASSDHFVRAYGETYGLPFVISNCSNNYGEYHFRKSLYPFYKQHHKQQTFACVWNGNFTRDWLYVQDHARAIDLIFHKGKNGETYNIGGFNEWKNIG